MSEGCEIEMIARAREMLFSPPMPFEVNVCVDRAHHSNQPHLEKHIEIQQLTNVNSPRYELAM